MLSKEDWMNIKAQFEKGVYFKDIAMVSPSMIYVRRTAI